MRFIVSFFVAALLFIACNTGTENDKARGASEQNIPGLFERKGQLAAATEWQKTKDKVAELMAKIETNPTDVKPRLQLATIYITEARITGEHPYYYPAITKILDGVLLIDSRNFEATVLKASVKMSQHKFEAAKQLALTAQQLNPNNAYVYGILVDANIELGKYDDAITASDKMQSLKPSLEAYARASYLREIFGDYPGAISAMQLAVQAGLPGSEPQSWSQKTLAELYLHTNQLDKAEIEYKKILAVRPSYAFAMAGLAKVEEKKKQYQQALALLDSAAAILPEFSFHEQMGDIYTTLGDKDMAAKKYAEVKTMLQEDEASGHLVGLEMARLYIKMNALDSAKKYAEVEYAQRPENIEVNKELAWITYNLKDTAKANQYMQVAMRTGSKDPDLLSRWAIMNKNK